MELKKYIVDKLTALQEEFGYFDPLYEYDSYSNTSFIQVIPEFLNKNEEFELKCGEIIMEMIDIFPGEYICFITLDSLIKLTNPTKLFATPISASRFVIGNLHFNVANRDYCYSNDSAYYLAA